MKTLCSKLVRFLSVLSLIVWAVGPRVSAQSPPSLGVRLSAGQPTLILTGEVGTVYSIEYASDLSSSNWVDRALLQAQGATNVWTDPAPPSTGQRFYRAVSVTTPYDPNLVFIQPGTFTMGSPSNEVGRATDEGPQTTVTISSGFWMGKYPVTQDDYMAIRGSNPSYFTPANGYSTDGTWPVEGPSWSDSTNYCDLRTQQELAGAMIPATPNLAYRLPTEAEWEYACRAGTTTRFSYGDDPGYLSLTNHAWYNKNAGFMTHAVGQKLPNPWELYDMGGNVSQWCQDRYGPYLGGSVIDPQGPATGTFYVCRNGGYSDSASHLRSASRNEFTSVGGTASVGLRVVLALAPSP